MDDDALNCIKRMLKEQNSVKKILEAHDRINSVLSPANQIAKHLNSIKTPDLDFLNLASASSALNALEKASLANKSISTFVEKTNSLDRTIATYAKHFSLPGISEAERIAELINKDLYKSLQRYGEQVPNIQQAMASMHAPWLDTLHAAQSIRGFAEIQTIGNALNAMPSFGAQFTDSLRIDLGDWRDSITWPEQIFIDPVARTDFYVERGLNTALTDFPEEAFHEGLSIAGVMRDQPALVARFDQPIALINKEEDEEALVRTNKAHDWLQRLETQLRQFIEEAMTKSFGADWAKHRLPNGIYEKWVEKKEKAEKYGGRQWPLISYADFTEYSLVICKADNWREVFAPFFERQESLRESLQRLHPIRICTMHSRPITQDDEIFLYVEIRRLAKALRFTK